jgi:hypothetical protein
MTPGTMAATVLDKSDDKRSGTPARSTGVKFIQMLARMPIQKISRPNSAQRSASCHRPC